MSTSELSEPQMDPTEKYLYPEIEPFNTGLLKVSDLHSIYYEQSGNKDGLPVVRIHGGPGGASRSHDRRIFDPKVYNIILFDQRGCGQSTPPFSLEENNTSALLSDMEKLREHLSVDRWVVCGMSWGSTLALLYTEKHINRVLALILGGVFTFRQKEIEWLYQENGASLIFPDLYDKLIEEIPIEERGNLVKAYHKRVNGENESEALKYAKLWAAWEANVVKLRVNQEKIKAMLEDEALLPAVKIEIHYFMNNGFLEPNQIIENVGIIAKSAIPVIIIHGRYDMICPARNAWDLVKHLPQAEVYFVEDAGHSPKELGSIIKLIEVCDKLANLCSSIDLEYYVN